MNYELKKASYEDKVFLKEAKLASIIEYATNLTEEEQKEIISYIDEELAKQIKSYKLIYVAKEKVGCLLTSKYKDGILLNELYLTEEYRNKGIGSAIINKIMQTTLPIYLWVYKKNKRAIKLYKKLGFKIIESTKNRNLMKYD